MPVFVSKFGGTSLSSGERFLHVLNIVRENPKRRFVVVSAPGKRFKGDEKITDLLLECAESKGKAIFAEVRRRFGRIAECAGVSIEEEMEECEKKIFSGASKAYAASRGEFLSAKIFSKMSGFSFLDPVSAVYFEKGAINENKTKSAIQSAFQREGRIVMPGFYGADENGSVFLFPRGGSDTSGAIAADAVCAELYENWTDVDGVFDKDPNKHEDARIIRCLSYDETERIVNRGAAVLHPDAVFWARKNQTPILVKNTFHPDHPGTLIKQ